MCGLIRNCSPTFDTRFSSPKDVSLHPQNLYLRGVNLHPAQKPTLLSEKGTNFSSSLLQHRRTQIILTIRLILLEDCHHVENHSRYVAFYHRTSFKKRFIPPLIEILTWFTPPHSRSAFQRHWTPWVLYRDQEAKLPWDCRAVSMPPPQPASE